MEAETDEMDALDARRVTVISGAELRFNLEKRITQRSKRNIGIEEIKKILENEQTGFITLKVGAAPALPSPRKPPRKQPLVPDPPSKPVFNLDPKTTETVEKLQETPRLPFEKSSESPVNSIIINIDSEGTSPTVQHIYRPSRGHSQLNIRQEEQKQTLKKQNPTLQIASWGLEIEPGKQEEVRAPMPSPRETLLPQYTTLNIPDLKLETSLSDMIVPTSRLSHKKKRKKRFPSPFLQELSAYSVTPHAGRLIQVREYLIEDSNYAKLPSIYSQEVMKSMSLIGTSEKYRRGKEWESPGAFRQGYRGIKSGGNRVKSESPMTYSGYKSRKMWLKLL